MSTDYLSRDSFDGAGGGSPYPSFGQLPENYEGMDAEPAPASSIPPAAAAADPIASFINDGVRSLPPANDRQKAIASPPGPVIAEAVEASDDNNTATRQTVEMMCGYVRNALTDPYMGYLAHGAARLFSAGRIDPMSAAWAVFWFLKHRVKKTYDEATMFRLGVPNQQDLLTDPRVLLRQADAAEDCDGFTMAAWALLASLGVETCMVTVACDPSDRARWSHVFNMIKLPNGNWLPLDCSHGARPGWMVPRAHISRWQAWDLNGQPIEAKPPSQSTLHGYMFRPRSMGRGVGDDGSSADLSGFFSGLETGNAPTIDFSGAADSTDAWLASLGLPSQSAVSPNPAGVQLGTTPGTASWASGTNNWLGPLFNTIGTAAKVIQNETLPVGTVIRNADGSITANLGPAAAASGFNINSLLGGVGGSSTLLLIGGGLLLAVLVASMFGGKR